MIWLRRMLAQAWPLLGVKMLSRGVLFVFATLQLDAVVDWGRTSTELAMLPPGQQGAMGAALVLLFGVDVGGVLRDTVQDSRLRWLWRAPHHPGHAGVATLILALLATLPVAAVGLLFAGLGGGALWLGAGVCATAAAHRDRVLLLGSVAVSAAMIALPPLVWTLPLLALTVSRIGAAADTQRVVGGRPTRSAPSALGPTSALIRLDLLTLRRLAPGIFVFAGLAGPGLALAQTAARVNGPYVGWDGTRAALLFLLCIAPTLAQGATLIAKGLGRHLAASRWPVSARHRAWAWVGSLVLLLTPAWLGLLIGGAGPWAPLHLLVALLALAAGATAAVTWRPAASRNHGVGAHLWWTGAMALVAWQPPPESTGVLALLTLAAVEFTAARIRKERRTC